MYRPLIKAGHLENLTDARYFAAKDVTWLGFDLDPNDPESISFQELNAISEWVEGPKIIAEVGFLGFDAERVLAQLSGVDGIQVSGFTQLDRTMLGKGQVVIREFILEGNGELPADLSALQKDEIVLFDLEKNRVTPEALGKTYEDYLKWLRTWISGTREYILDVPFTGDKLHQFVEDFKPRAIQLKGGGEEKVGYKSYDEIDAYFDYYDDWA